MTCNEARQHWNLYHDSEGDSEIHFRISEHLAICPACAEWFHSQSRLEELLTEKLRTGKPTPSLWHQVKRESGLEPRRKPQHLWMAGLAAALAVVAILVWSGHHTPARADLSKLTAERHRQFIEGRQVPDFSSDSDLEIERFLRQRVTFPVRCPPRKDAGFSVQGAGVCELARQPTAYLVGTVQNEPVSIFILHRGDSSSFPPRNPRCSGSPSIAAGKEHMPWSWR